MDIFRRRPLASAVAFSLAGSAAALFLSGSGKLILCVLLAAAGFFAPRLTRRIRDFRLCGAPAGEVMRLALWLTAALTVSSFFCFDVNAARYEKLAADGELHTVSGYVLEIGYDTGYGASYTVRLEKIDDRLSAGKGMVSGGEMNGLSVGDAFTVSVRFTAADKGLESYGLTSSDLLAEHICFSCEAAGRPITERAHFAPELLLCRLRGFLDGLISVRFDRKTAAFAKALLLADRGELGTVRRDFGRIGTSHLLALSGLHLTFFLIPAEYLLSDVCGLEKRKRNLLLGMLVLAFMLFSGPPGSVIRAGVMALVGLSAFYADADAEPVTLLFIAAFLLFFVDPAARYDEGFAMSFAATLGILTLSRDLIERFCTPVRRFMRKKPARVRVPCLCLLTIMTSVFLSVGATVFILPFQWKLFGALPLLGIPATLLLTPLIELMLLLFPVVLILPKGISQLLVPLPTLVCRLTEWLAGTMARTDTAVPLCYPFTAPIFLTLAAVLLVMAARNRLKWRFSLIPLGAAAAVFAVCLCLNGGEPVLYYETDLKNDALLIVDEGDAMLVDVSDGSTAFARRYAGTLPGFSAAELDTLLFTHLHSAHVRELRELFDNTLIRRICIPEPLDEKEGQTAQSLAEFAQENRIAVLFYPRGRPISFNGTAVTVSEPDYLKRSVQPLVAVTIDCETGRTVYLGSSVWEREETEALARTADILVIGSHGPNVKTEPGFDPETVRPALTVSPFGETPDETDTGMLSLPDGFSAVRLTAPDTGKNGKP